MPLIRVVIVDDCPEYRQLLSLHLDANDIVVVGEAGDGESGLEAVRNTEPDLVVTDLQMPGTDGLWLARRLRDSHPTLPVVMATTRSHCEAVGDDARGAGVAQLVSKRGGAAAVAAAVGGTLALRPVA